MGTLFYDLVLTLFPAPSLTIPSMFQLLINQNIHSSKCNCACSFSLQVLYILLLLLGTSSHTTPSLPNATQPWLLILYFFKGLLQGTPELPSGFPQYYLITTYFSINQLTLCYNQLSAHLVISPTRQFLYCRYPCILTLPA